MSTVSTTIDVRAIAPRERHPMIFAALEDLASGDALEIVNDHDPKPLYYQIQAEAPGAFSWAYLESGPEVWRVSIRRQAGSCCGACGGAA